MLLFNKHGLVDGDIKPLSKKSAARKGSEKKV